VNIAKDDIQHAQSQSPQIKVLDPSKYSIFLERTDTGLKSVPHITAEHYSQQQRYQFLIPSENELIFVLSGPKTPLLHQTCDDQQAEGLHFNDARTSGNVTNNTSNNNNIAVRWGSDPSGLVVIGSVGANKLLRLPLQPLDDGWMAVRVPLIPETKAAIPDPIKLGASPAGKYAIEVHTLLRDFNASGQHIVIETRLEHFSAGRIAFAGWWMKEKTRVKTGAVGYAGCDRQVLAKQACAAKCWMMTAREVLLHSKWAHALVSAGICSVHLMGFEVNNPFHDDFEGIGPHWHLALRRISKENVWSCLHPVPHLYFNSYGLHDVTGHFGLKQPQLAAAEAEPQHTRVEGGVDILEGFATFLRADGGMDILPLVVLESEEAVGQYLHVRNQWGKWHPNRVFQLSENRNNQGTLFGLQWDAKTGGVMLRSVFSGRYVTGSSTFGLAGEKWSVLSLQVTPTESSLWDIVHETDPASGRVRTRLRCRNAANSNSRSSGLHVRKTWKELIQKNRKEEVFMFHKDNDGSSGSFWKIHARCPEMQVLLFNSYSIKLAVASSPQSDWFALSIERNGIFDRQVEVQDNSENGTVICKQLAMIGDKLRIIAPSSYLHFDYLTGERR
jgi:hypothetical protein